MITKSSVKKTYTDQEILYNINSSIKAKYQKDLTGHDYYHIDRVRRLAKFIAEKENADIFIVELGSLMHEFADWKFVKDWDKAIVNTRQFLLKHGLDSDSIDKVIHIVKSSSFKNTLNKKDGLTSLEGFIVRDADMLDSIGAIGIARAFYFGGTYSMKMHDPDLIIKTNLSEEQYKNGSTCIGYFYEKLLKVKKTIKTRTAKKIAQKRHLFLDRFLRQFLKEWSVD